MIDLKKHILPAMALAPSAHNTQPWQFVLRDNVIEVYVDEQRHLVVSDPTKRELYLSLGCTIFNGRVAAANQGVGTTVEYSPSGNLAARIMITSDEAESDLAALYEAVASRRTDRALYDGKPLTEQESKVLSAFDNPAVRACTDKQQIDRLGKLTGQGAFTSLARKDIKVELSKWVRNNWTRKPDGMTGYAMLMPAPVSLMAPFMVRVAPIHKQEGPKTAAQITSSSVVAVITSIADSPSQWMQVGQTLERLWLEATRAELAAAPLALAIEAGEEIRRAVQEVVQTDQLPQAILRIGHSGRVNLKPTPRRSVEDCLRP